MRKRVSLEEKYQLSPEQAAQFILSAARSYEDVEGYDQGTALEVALSDWTFWYQGNEERWKALQDILESGG